METSLWHERFACIRPRKIGANRLRFLHYPGQCLHIHFRGMCNSPQILHLAVHHPLHIWIYPDPSAYVNCTSIIHKRGPLSTKNIHLCTHLQHPVTPIPRFHTFHKLRKSFLLGRKELVQFLIGFLRGFESEMVSAI